MWKQDLCVMSVAIAVASNFFELFVKRDRQGQCFMGEM
jgi:hypothetical protein